MKAISKPTAATSLIAAQNSASAPACGAIAPTITSIGTTARSCATSTASVSRPPSVSFSSESSIILIASAVDDTASMNPITTALDVSPEVSCDSDSVKPTAATTSASAMPSARGKSARNAASRNSMPMMNSSISTPRLASVSIELELSISPNPVGPSSMPTRMNPAAAGMRTRFINRPQATAAASTRARAVRSWVCAMRQSQLVVADDRLGA